MSSGVDDLVARLRKYAPAGTKPTVAAIMDDAATALEAAQARIAELEAERDRAREALSKADAALEILTPTSISQFKNKLAAQTLIAAALKEPRHD